MLLQVYLVFRRPFLKTKENITIHPVHSRLTCLQGASSFLHYPLEEAPEVIAEIAWGKERSQLTTQQLQPMNSLNTQVPNDE